MIAQRLQVAVAAAGLWTSPDAVRPLDAPALESPVRLRDWSAVQGPRERRDLWGRLDSQVLLGDTVEVDDVKEGWAQVVVPSQPSRKDPRGYPGWLPLSQLAEPAPDTDAAVVVSVPLTEVRMTPAGEILHADVGFSTILPSLGSAGGWTRVALPGGGSGWVVDTHIAPYRAGRGATTEEVLAAGRRFLRVMYLAAGVTGRGLDCSGLTWTVYRRFGITLPRDAADQAALGEQIDLAGLLPGDLMFFRKDDSGFVYHVGICAEVMDGWPSMLHASQTDWDTIDTPLSKIRHSHLYAARRITARSE